MQDQHKHITGYRDLTAEEIGLMNEAKALAETVGALVKKIEGEVGSSTALAEALESEEIETDRLDAMFAAAGDAYESRRWLEIGKGHLQQGFMALTRAIAKPTTF